jgi:hypothetical protein
MKNTLRSELIQFILRNIFRQNIIIKDNLFFVYYDFYQGYQAKISLKRYGVDKEISIRYLGPGLNCKEGTPYEVWYPDESAPINNQDIYDIYNYVSKFLK